MIKEISIMLLNLIGAIVNIIIFINGTTNWAYLNLICAVINIIIIIWLLLED
jgi:hypothetical protein